MIATDSRTVADASYVFHVVRGACKGTGSAIFATKAKGEALYLYGGWGEHRINDPSDGTSHHWSDQSSLNCGNPPPPPSRDDICRAVGGRSSRSALGSPGHRGGGGVIPIC